MFKKNIKLLRISPEIKEKEKKEKNEKEEGPANLLRKIQKWDDKY